MALIAFQLFGNATYQLYNATQHRHANYHYQPASQAGFPEWTKGQPKPEPYQPNCNQPTNAGDAELCAQWAAVAQVTETNRLTSLSLKLSLAALIATFFGTGLLVWTLHETRQTARRELRAYVSVEMVGIEFVPTDHSLSNFKAAAHIRLKNGGQTPAYFCRHAGNIFGRTDEEAERDIVHSPRQSLGQAKPFTLHMNDPQMATVYAHEPISRKEMAEIIEGEKWLYVFGTVYYRDTFENDQTTSFCVKTDDLDLPPVNPLERAKRQASRRHITWIMAEFHNGST